ncbi:hypothetical protein DL98DRAFT_534080 [Cadophora sp. DSE1049]|nr:hypothetical protein DL98DRAFT_534080 [Cadophora sp. DSE1049]
MAGDYQNGAEHREGDSSAGQGHLSTDMHPVAHKMTTHGYRQLMPQPSNDPRDPLSWSPTRKWSLFAIMIYGTFANIATAVANVLATPVQAEDWGITGTEAAYSISCVLAGIILGPVFLVPLRGKAFAIYSSIYLIGQVGSPKFSGFIVEFVDWLVCFWWTVGANFLAAILIFLFGEETGWDHENQRPLATADLPDSWFGRRIALFFPGTKVASPNWKENSLISLKATFLIGISPVTVLAGLYGMVFQGWFIMVGIQIPLILSTPAAMGGYGFSPLGVSNFYFSAWIGALFAVIYGILVNDNIPKLLQRSNNSACHVEYRLHSAWFPALIVEPIGCGLFSATLLHHWHYVILGLAEVFIVSAVVASVTVQ